MVCMRVSVVATGIDSVAAEQPRPQVLTVSEAPTVRHIRPEAPVRRSPGQTCTCGATGNGCCCTGRSQTGRDDRSGNRTNRHGSGRSRCG